MAGNDGNATTKFESDETRVHVVSFFAFLEFRVPIQVGKTWLAPYGRFGLGMNLNFNDNRDEIILVNNSFGMFVSLGLECYVAERISFFLEPRWFYNHTEIRFEPNDTSKFAGKVDLSNFSILAGINIYFGSGKTF